MIAYHPECPHCKIIVKDVEQLHEYILSKKIPVNLILINMSKTMKYIDDLKIDGVPAIKLYGNNGTVAEFKHSPTLNNFKTFMQENGIKWTEWN